MRKLLHANFSRLWKDKVFWLGTAVAIIAAIYSIIYAVSEPAEYRSELVSLMFGSGELISLVVAAIVGFFIGTEYSSGTIRNKVVSGHSRASIYLANWLVSAAAAAIVHFAYLLTTVGLGVVLHWTIVVKPSALLLLCLVSTVSVIALCTVFLLIAMLIHNKPIAIAILLLLTVGLSYYDGIVDERLHESEYINYYAWYDEEGVLHEEQSVENPHYPTGALRRYYEIMYDLLPGSQIRQVRDISISAYGAKGVLTAEQNRSMALFFGYSALLILLCNGCGVLIFRKKDLK